MKLISNSCTQRLTLPPEFRIVILGKDLKGHQGAWEIRFITVSLLPTASLIQGSGPARRARIT